MSIFGHHRWKIFNANQHPYKHTLDDFAYTNPAIAGEVTTLEGALNWLFAVLYPQTQASVANVAALPAVGNTLNDYRVVEDDGDGSAAGYRWEQREGEVAASWHKIYDMDWGSDSILEAFQNRTQDLYVHRQGYDDLDATGTVLTGSSGGQTVYGGKTASKHLTFKANSGDGVGAATGYVQFGDNARPQADSTYSLGTTAERFLKIWTDELTSGTLTAIAGSITDSSGAITFDNENLSTTGTLASGTLTVSADMIIATGSITSASGAITFVDENLSTTGTLASGVHTIGTLVLGAASITDTSGSISFDNENLVTTGTLGAGVATFTQTNTDNVRLDGNTVSSTNTDGNLILAANGTGVVNVTSVLTTIGQTVTGDVGVTGTHTVTGQLNVDNLRFDGTTISTTNTNGIIALAPDGSGVVTTTAIFRPTTDGTLDLGATGTRWNNIYFDGALGDGTTTIAQSVLQSLRDINGSVNSGDSIFWNGSKWVCSAPDTEIDHGTVSGLADDDHTQYALLLGRSGGQVLIGGTGSGDDLALESTSHGTKGSIYFKSSAEAFTDAAYSGGWAGANVGGVSNRFVHVYTAGEFFGLRLENVGALPSSSSQREGRLVFLTTDDAIYADDGAALTRKSIKRYEEDLSFDGIVTSKSVTVSGLDARKAIWVLKDNTNNYEQLFVELTSTGSTNLTVTTNSPLPVGTYRLIGIE
jgi:hypothetical protein